RRIATVAVGHDEGVVAIGKGPPAPATALQMVVDVVLARLRVHTAEEEVAGRPPFRRSDPIGHGLRQGAEDQVDHPRVTFGVAGHRGASVAHVAATSGWSADLDR